MKGIFNFVFSKRFIINLIILMILVLGSFYLLNKSLSSYTLHDESIEVPNIKGYHRSELENLFTELDLNYTVIDSVFDEEYGPGEVVSQIPGSGSKVKPGRKLYLTLNASEKPKIRMPDLKDRTKRQAIAVLETYGIEVGDFIYRPSYCTDCVLEIQIDSTIIEAGTMLTKGTMVNLVLGAGESDEFIAVPLLIDKKYDEVLSMTRFLGINPVVIHEDYETDDDSINAKVFMQIPKYDSTGLIPLGSQIKVFFTSDYNKIPEFAVDSSAIDSLP
jgi:beta-lactam-binding protein with PASTA domain